MKKNEQEGSLKELASENKPNLSDIQAELARIGVPVTQDIGFSGFYLEAKQEGHVAFFYGQYGGITIPMAMALEALKRYPKIDYPTKGFFDPFYDIWRFISISGGCFE